MSYRQPNTGDSLNDYFTALTDFVIISPNLLKADSERNFEIWLEKLALIDRRALFLFLKKHRDEIPPNHMKLAQLRFVKDLYED